VLMVKVILCILSVLVVIYAVPFLVYGLGSRVAGLKIPDGASPVPFLISVLVTKTGTAIAFVLIFYFARDSLGGEWVLYAFIWWLMFVIGELGQTILPGYSWKEAVAGIISETLYFPLAAWLTDRLLGLQ